MIRFALLVVVSALLAVPESAQGHAFSRSYSRWEFAQRTVSVSAKLPVLEFARIDKRFLRKTSTRIATDPELSRAALGIIEAGIAPDDPNADCRLESDPILRADRPNLLRYEASYLCQRPPQPRIAVGLFYDQAPNHIHFAHMDHADGAADFAMNSDRRIASVGDEAEAVVAGETRDSSFGGLIAFGVLHVAGGFDHIAFVIGLLLLGGGFRTLAKIATGFTLGHSLTLAAASIGFVQANEAGVEILVGLSIAYVALESAYVSAPRMGRRNLFIMNLLLHAALGGLSIFAAAPIAPVAVGGSALFTSCHLTIHRGPNPSTSPRVGLAFLFGLIHGFAFASALGDALEGSALATTLLGFNLGVEIGQIAVIAPVGLALGVLAGKMGERRFRIAQASLASLLLSVGLYWTFGRALGL